MTIPVIDLFAGPGGLGEGFSAFEPALVCENQAEARGSAARRSQPPGGRAFRIALSVEKDPWAWQTLRLRSFFRQFEREDVPELYYDLLRGEIALAEFPDRLKAASPEWFERWLQAGEEARQIELGGKDHDREALFERIETAIEGAEGRWVLIGGPPCQAYSVVGRSRNKGKEGYVIEKDHRSSLYKEYLQIIADHWPAVFVMENVKGMLSAKLDGKLVFERILDDLHDPQQAMGRSERSGKSYRYRILPIVAGGSRSESERLDPRDFVVQCEQYGIPQTRHRVILIGIREDLGEVDLPRLQTSDAPTVKQVIGGMPPLRSGVSRTAAAAGYAKVRDSRDIWITTIGRQVYVDADGQVRRWVESLRPLADGKVVEAVELAVATIVDSELDLGGAFVPCEPEDSGKNPLEQWLFDARLGGVCNHESRMHLDKDLPRYLFAAAYASVCNDSPRPEQFHKDLLPKHLNVDTGHFDDRFRVQLADRPSTTITSHL